MAGKKRRPNKGFARWMDDIIVAAGMTDTAKRTATLNKLFAQQAKHLPTGQKQRPPTPVSQATFDAIRDLLRPCEAGLQVETGELPPTYTLRSKPRKKEKFGKDFATLWVDGAYVFLYLFPLGWNRDLRDRVGSALRKRQHGSDDFGFAFSRVTPKLCAEIASIAQACHDWFRRNVLTDARAITLPAESLDAYAFEFLGDEGPGETEPLGRASPLLLSRLREAYGAGRWRRRKMTGEVLLPGWKSLCRVEVHQYERSLSEGEGMKIKRFLNTDETERESSGRLRYVADADFRASLIKNNTYPSLATIGPRNQEYVRIIDESGEDYWYPARLFGVLIDGPR
jgi:hypothetical protein